MQLKFVKWDTDITKAPDAEEDDYCFDASNYMYKLLALVLSDQLTTEPKGDLNKFIASLSVEKVIKDKREKIEDPDELWSDIKSEVGAEHSAVIIPILKGE
jgi:hypothetical protein